MPKKGAGERYQEESKYTRETMGSGKEVDWKGQPDLYKVYRDCERTVTLPPPKGSDETLEAVLKHRRSVRHYHERSLNLEQLSYLLWASGGISTVERGFGYRTAPSAGALYPIETYLVVNSVEGLDQGVYHYCVKDHTLELLKEGDFSIHLARAALGQKMAQTAPVVFVWSAIYQRSRWKYGPRAFRYIYMDAAHMAENLALAAVSLKLGSVQIGALFDDEVNAIIEVDGEEESVVYMTSVGYPR